MDRDYAAGVGMTRGFSRERILLLGKFCCLITVRSQHSCMRKEMLRNLLTEAAISVHNFYVESDVAACIS